ncbi:CCGSCS motif protein [Marinobacter nauticus]|nr:CCGSCS motif protein [Marinobacter nauticus]MBY6103200.1 CCGSCS motif protein [Marinobacter nauticus]
MALSFVNIFKKEDAESESNGVEHVEASGIAETQNDEPKKGGHGEGGTCCGSCS